MADDLSKYLRLFKQKPSSAFVMVEDTPRFARDAADSGAVNTASNSEIGAKHEFGLGVPRRSFLRMPLETKLPDFLNKILGDGKAAEESIRESGSLDPIMEAIAVACKETIEAAFDTGGFGNWPALSPNTENETGQILNDTKQLRNSIKTGIK